MYILELNDIIFFIRNLKYPHEGFNINSYVSFVLMQQPTTNYNIIDHLPMQLTIFRLPRLWNALPVIDPALDTKVIKYKQTQYLWCNFNHNFSPDNACTYYFICICSKCSQLPTVNNYHNLD